MSLVGRGCLATSAPRLASRPAPTPTTAPATTSSVLLADGARVTYNYDAMGRVDGQTVEKGAGGSQTRAYATDDRGRLATRTIDGVEDSYEYEEPGWLRYEVRDTGTDAERTLDYDYGNLLATVTVPDGTVSTVSRDAFGGTTRDDLRGLLYEYGADGHPTEVRDSASGTRLHACVRDARRRPDDRGDQ